MTIAQHKTRLIKRVPPRRVLPGEGTTHKERELGVSLEWLDEANGFKRLWESERWIPQPYQIPENGIIPAHIFYDGKIGQYTEFCPQIVTDAHFFNTVIIYKR